MQDVFNGLTEKDLRDIQVVRAYFSDKDESDLLAPSAWLQHWQYNKNQYLKFLFKDNLILERQVSYHQEQYELSHVISRVVFNDFCTYGATDEQKKAMDWKTAMENFYRPLRDSSNPEVQRAWCDIGCLMESWYLASNEFVQGTDTRPSIVPYGDGKTFKIQPHCKVSKALGKLSQIAGLQDEWEPIRIKISQVLNQSKLTGTLHLSIHPMDYFTASLNDYDWQSCMNFIDGDYRRGVIEMMNSPMVVVAYLTGANKKFQVINDVYANNKKWREFFIITPEMISGVKGYPYWSTELEAQTINWLRELIAAAHDELPERFKRVTWIDGIQKFRVGETNELKGINYPVSFDIRCGPAMYDDFYHGEVYQAIFSDKIPMTYCLDYSGFSECLICGNECDEDDEPNDVVCGCCNDYVHCVGCGDRYHKGDIHIVEFDGQYYCSYCYDNLTRCESCGEIIGNDYNVYYFTKTAENGNKYLLEEGKVLCEDCLENYLKNPEAVKEITPPWIYYATWHTISAIDVDDLTEEGQQELFNRPLDEVFNEFSCWNLNTKEAPKPLDEKIPF